MIKNLIPSLPEVGKIKIGFKGKMVTSRQGKKFQPPKKLDHFIVTTLERGPDENFIRDQAMHEVLGTEPTEIPIRLLYDDPELNFLTRYTCYDGTLLWCTGDGEQASQVIKGQNDQHERKQVNCPCERLQPAFNGRGKCKYNGVLSVVLDCGAMVGGVWKLRTTSYNSVTNIMSSLALISRVTGGVLAGIPLVLTFSKKTTTVPTTSQQTTIPVIGLIYKGTIQQLADIGQRTALEFAGQRERIKRIEDIARKELDDEILTAGETHEDITAEFFPEEAANANGQEQGKEPVACAAYSYDDLVRAKVDTEPVNISALVDFVHASAKALNKKPDEIKTLATESFDDFWQQFNAWQEKHFTEQPEGAKHTCEICGYEAASPRGLKRHNTQQHPPETPPAEQPDLPPEGPPDPGPETIVDHGEATKKEYGKYDSPRTENPNGAAAKRESIVRELQSLEDFNPEAVATAKTQAGFISAPNLETAPLPGLQKWLDCTMAELDRAAKAKKDTKPF